MQTVNWIQDFLTGRTQVVKYQNCISSATSVISSVPQRTVIGPVAFLSFINNLPEKVVSRLYLFADDTKCAEKSLVLYSRLSTTTIRH